MDFEVVKIGDGIHVSVNDVVSSTFVRGTDGGWAIMVPRHESGNPRADGRREHLSSIPRAYRKHWREGK